MEKENDVFVYEGKIGGTIPYGISGMNPDNELNCNFFKPNWENSMYQSNLFVSALSSIVSSPTASNANGNNGENLVLRELICRHGSICDSGKISPRQQHNYSCINGNNSANTSCYSRPLNSPPKLNLSSMLGNHQFRGNFQVSGNHFPTLPTLAPFSTDPGFAERAARFSCFANKGLSEMAPILYSCKTSRVSCNQRMKISGSHPTVQENWDGISPSDKKFSGLSRSSAPENGNSRENSSVSEQIPGVGLGMSAQNDASSRKRKSPKGKGKEETLAAVFPAKDTYGALSESSESNAKRSKSEDEKDAEKANRKQSSKDNNSKPPEPPKDYIHVRARRGQATDAHSLAERVRREKISDRMKVLQDLVPGCNKVTGKAVMLDEIINYVQSLQRQVEFLSMKLATVNPRTVFNIEALMSPKDMFQSRGSLTHNIYPSECYPFQSQPNLHSSIPCGTEASLPHNNFGAALARSQLPPIDNFSETASQVSSTFREDDLHSTVQMGLGPNQTQNSQGILPTPQMKAEL